MAEPKKHHLVKLVSTVVVGWFEETKAHLVVYICRFLKRGGNYLPLRYMVLKTSFILKIFKSTWMSMNHRVQGMPAVKKELSPRKGLMHVNESVRRVGTNWCEQASSPPATNWCEQATRPLGGGNSKQEPKLVQLLLHEVQLFDQIWSRCQNWFWDGQHCGEKSS